MYDFVEASSLCPLSRCRTSGGRCSLCESMTNNITFTDWGFTVTAHPWCIYLLYTPIRSAKPPTGSRQVPVTNCSNLILFSLSISLTNCQQITVKHSECEILLKQSCNHTTTMFPQYDRLLIAASVTHGDAQNSAGLLPARTTRSVCCCERSACRWCFSASLPGLSPASRTASPAGRKSMRTLHGSNNCNSFVLVARGSVGTSNSLASKYWRYCWGKTSLKPSKNAWVCSSTPLDNLHSATNLQHTEPTQKNVLINKKGYKLITINSYP